MASDDQPTAPIAADRSDETPEQPAEQVPAAATPPPARARRMIGIPVAAAVAVGLVAVGGLGGYALAAAASGDDLTPVSDGRGGPFPGFPGDRDGDWHGFPGDGSGPPPDLDDNGSGTDDGADEDTGTTT